VSPRGNVNPLVHPPGVNTLYCLEEWRGEQSSLPQWITSPPEDKIHPWGTTSLVGAKFAPSCEVKNGPQESHNEKPVQGFYFMR
jgi:hypothetical protein